MKQLFLSIALLFCASVFAQNSTPKPFVIPELREWNATTKGVFKIAEKGVIVVPEAQSAELMPIAKQFAEDLRLMFDLKMAVKIGTPQAGNILLSVNPANVNIENREAYAINIDQSVSIYANEPIGVLWATKTLLQMGESSLKLPYGTIRDFPAYPVRGYMLDVARKYFSLDYLKATVKIMSYYKMNTFQVHLNDNGFKQFFGDDWSKTYAAFRLESETYPGLAAKDGHYTKKDFRQFQLDALALGVTIIPEIDAPAHTLAFAHYKPEIGSKNYGADHLELFSDETYKFMDGLFKEYLEGDEPVFVGKVVHIGTDEYSNKDKAVIEKFRYFTDHYIKYVESFGKQAMMWGALTHAKGETPVKVKDVLMGLWYNGYADPKDMFAMGYDCISIPDGLLYIVPEAGYYYNYLNTKHLYETWTPAVIGNQIFDEQLPQLKGGMFAVWNDHSGNGISFQDVHHRVVPAIQTLAVKMWDGKSVTLPFAEFDVKRQSLSEAPGVNILARAKGNKKGELLNIASPKQGSTNVISDIGYNYRVQFDLTAAQNDKGTVLFESPSSKFYLTDPEQGKLGYSRDGYNYCFNYAAPIGAKVAIAIEGTNRSTKLFVDGKLVESLDVVPQSSDPKSPMAKMNRVQTLVFPLAQLGQFKGKIENLKVTALPN